MSSTVEVVTTSDSLSLYLGMPPGLPQEKREAVFHLVESIRFRTLQVGRLMAETAICMDQLKEHFPPGTPLSSSAR